MRVNHIGSIRYPRISGAGPRWRRHIGYALVAAVTMSLLSVGLAMAQEAGAEAAQAPAVPVPGKNGKICQHEDVTGSRMKKRVCHTPEQWEARERAARDMVRELDRKSPGGPRDE
ncbi:hypothetical protein [Luteimonas sp. SDU101]|uniref:hypothetical protein n=1 Tax=unclassified Luteimonas TaxID=2629088 RepID=UPI003EBAFB2D